MIDERAIRGPQVVVYATKTCQYCALATSYLRGKGVAFTEYDVSSDRNRAQEMFKLTGQKGVPVLVINGTLVVGFNKNAIDDALSNWLVF